MITEEELQKTNISLIYNISPVKNIITNVGAMIGNFCEEMVGSFYPKKISRKANIVITELLSNAVENIIDRESNIHLKLKIDKSRLRVHVANVANKQQYEKVRSHIDIINSSNDAKKLLENTIYNRKRMGMKGGLGLIRLVAENKFTLSVDYEEPYMRVESQFPLGGSS